MDPYTPPTDPSPPPSMTWREVRILRAPWKTRMQRIVPRILRPVTLLAYLSFLGVAAWYYFSHTPFPLFLGFLGLAPVLLNGPLKFIRAAARDDLALATRARDWIGGAAFAAGWAWKLSESNAWIKGSLYLGNGEIGFQAKGWILPGGEKMLRDRVVALRVGPAGMLEVTLAHGQVEEFRTGCAALWQQAFEEERTSALDSENREIAAAL